MAESGDCERRKITGAGMGAGIAIGVALGAAMDNWGAGIAIGVAIGVAIGAGLESRQRRNKPPADQSDPTSSD